ncbi:hypothetical protein [Psychromonas hadalis]|uniref:hypothetical protein n=1 Tax=Psychromonas hadalis TaxID=211669 RepID=UPI0003B5A2B2|nr:hypothetical protein [Psychromonas hadalis]
MKRILTLLSLLLFLLAPTLSFADRATESSSYSVERCIGEMSCASSAQKCCSSAFVSSFLVQENQPLSAFLSFQKIDYFQYDQQPLLGEHAALYRPPIV